MIVLDSYITGPAAFKTIFAIHTPQDFFTDFWEHRNDFEQDMSPEKVFYWDEKIKQAYQDISSFIGKFKEYKVLPSDEEIRLLQQSFLSFADIDDKKLTKEIINSVIETDNAERMIFLTNSPVLDLEQLKVFSKTTCVKKIEVGQQSACIIKLSGLEYEVPAGQCVYAVAKGRRFVLVLPREISCHDYRLNLINIPGQFASILHKEPLINGIQEEFENVISFSIIDNRKMIRVYADGSIDGEGASPLQASGFQAIYTLSDAKNNNGLVLYQLEEGQPNCILRTTIPGKKQSASFASFNNDGHLLIIEK